MKVSEIMTPSPACCTPDSTLQSVARTMRDHDCGSIPIVQGGQVVGIVTDRDLAIRALADGKSGNAKVSDVITRDPKCVDPDDDLRVLQKVMSENQVRRVPVVNSSGRCVGIVSQADLALAARQEKEVTDREVALVVERISEPTHRSNSRAGQPSTEWRL